MRPNLVQYTGMLRIKYVEFVWKYTGEWYVFDTYQLHVKAMKYYCNIIIWMEMENSKVLLQFLVIFRQFGDVLSFLYARRLRGYTATGTMMKNSSVYFVRLVILSIEKRLTKDRFSDHWNEIVNNLISKKSTEQISWLRNQWIKNSGSIWRKVKMRSLALERVS